MQSPINVQSSMAIYNRRLRHIVFNNYDSYASWNFTNNGHTSIVLYSSLFVVFSKLLN